MTTVTIKCKSCGVSSAKPAKEIARQRRNGRQSFYCSRGCAAGHTNVAYRPLAERPFTIKDQAKIAMRREGWKYAKLEAYLKRKGAKFCFEKPIGKYVCDLVLPTHKIVVEFDGDDHQRNDTREADAKRDRYLVGKGYQVVRIPVPTNTVIPGRTLSAIFR